MIVRVGRLDSRKLILGGDNIRITFDRGARLGSERRIFPLKVGDLARIIDARTHTDHAGVYRRKRSPVDAGDTIYFALDAGQFLLQTLFLVLQEVDIILGLLAR